MLRGTLLAGRAAPAPTLQRTALLAAIAALPAVAYGIVQGGVTRIGIAAAALLVGTVAALARRVRPRELVLWFAVLVAAFNFTPSLFRPESVLEEPLWSRTVKDLPLLAIFVVAVLVPRTTIVKQAALARRLDLFRGLVAAWAVVFLVEALITKGDPPVILVSARYYVVYPLVALAVRRLTLEEREVRRLFRLVILLGAVQALIAVADFIGLTPATFFQNYVFFGGNAYPRAIGTLGNPNNLGLFLGLPFLLLVASLEAPRRFAHQTLLSRGSAAVLIGPVLVGLALTFSRIVGVALAIAVVAQSRLVRGRPRVFLIGALAVILVVLVLQGRGAQGVGLLTGRQTAAIEATREWLGAPTTFLIGQGFGSQVAIEGGELLQTGVTDNMILELALEGGVLALLMLGLVVAAGTSVALGALRGRGAGDPVAAGLFGFIIFFLLYTPVAVNLRLFPGALLFWLSIGLGVELARSAGGHAGRRVAPSSVGRDQSPSP